MDNEKIITINFTEYGPLDFKLIRVLQVSDLPGFKGILRGCEKAPRRYRYRLDMPGFKAYYSSEEKATEAFFHDVYRDVARDAAEKYICPFDGEKCSHLCSLFDWENMKCFLSEATQALCKYLKNED